MAGGPPGIWGPHKTHFIGRGNLGVRIIDRGLGVGGLRFDASGQWLVLDIPQAEVFKDLFYGVLILDEGDDAHLPVALGASEGVYLVDFLDKPCPVLEVPFG
jgi:hypothetical protein